MSSRWLVCIAVLLTLLCVPVVVGESSATASYTINGAVISTFDDHKDIPAGQTVTLSVDVYNGNTDTIVVGMELLPSKVDASLVTKEISVDSNKMGSFGIVITTDKLMNHGTYTLNLKMTVYDFETKTTDVGTIPFTISVSSVYSDGSGFNKILGIFPPLPAPLDGVEVTVTVTVIIWAVIAVVAVCLLKLAVYFIIKNDKDIAKTVNRGTGILMTVGIMVYGASNALNVAGASDVLIATTMGASKIIYILVGAGIGWNIYHSVIELVFHRLEELKRFDGVDTSLIPLFRMLGMLVIILVTGSAIMSVIGFDLAAIVMGMGVAGMAISLGAQNTLTQFFSGLNIMMTRPFKIGDMVSIGNDSNIYEVKKVGMMNTTFKNWANQEYCIMPNNTVVASKIVNVTGTTVAYRMYLYYYSSYDADVELAKKTIMDVANSNPNVITDGSYSKPEVRLEDFEASAIKYRLAVYITDFRDNVKVMGQLNEAVYNALLEAGIGCPYDINDIYVYRE